MQCCNFACPRLPSRECGTPPTRRGVMQWWESSFETLRELHALEKLQGKPQEEQNQSELTCPAPGLETCVCTLYTS